MRTLILAAASTLLLCSSVFAETLEVKYAQLSSVTGKVLVDQGEGFRPVTATTRLVPGNRIMVSSEGGAILTYGPGCSMPLSPDSLTTFTGTEACVIGTQGKRMPGAGFLLFGSVGAIGPAAISIGSSIGSSDNISEPPPQS